IYSRLMRISTFSYPKSTIDEFVYATSVHTELPWYNDEGQLTIKPDITILNPRALSILHGIDNNRLRLPSKQFEFGGSSIILELKFIRGRQGINKKVFEEKIMEDINKINGLFDRIEREGMGNQVFCFFVIFSKTNKRCNDFIEFLREHGQSNRHKIIY